ncbi:hypothetical protein LR48_Vigan635s001900 [Vigna angularis]|uniref:Uncharacterized protein n=1 Tax=Phaseolus angularis TaxID=3914 RepID=A0A0L9TG51_PHAAN|nr:hypothetical protein LR48_Vigan635s001900 [Vigna angularis]
MAESSRRRRRRTSAVSENPVPTRDATVEGWLSDEADQLSFSRFWKERKLIKQKFIDLSWYISYNFSFPNLIIEQGVQHLMELRGRDLSLITSKEHFFLEYTKLLQTLSDPQLSQRSFAVKLLIPVSEKRKESHRFQKEEEEEREAPGEEEIRNEEERKDRTETKHTQEEKEESVWGVKMAGAEGEADGRKSTEETSVTAHAELRRIDSLNLEAGRVSMNAHKDNRASTMA